MLYLFDPTRRNKVSKKDAYYTYQNPREVVLHLEDIAPRLLGKSRHELMVDAADLGFGEDDREGKAFFDLMTEYVNMGIVRQDGKPVRCNIFTVRTYEGKSEYGD